MADPEKSHQAPPEAPGALSSSEYDSAISAPTDARLGSADHAAVPPPIDEKAAVRNRKSHRDGMPPPARPEAVSMTTGTSSSGTAQSSEASTQQGDEPVGAKKKRQQIAPVVPATSDEDTWSYAEQLRVSIICHFYCVF
jgi:hypothetical protein